MILATTSIGGVIAMLAMRAASDAAEEAAALANGGTGAARSPEPTREA